MTPIAPACRPRLLTEAGGPTPPRETGALRLVERDAWVGEQLRWRATLALRLEAFREAPEEPGAGLERLGARLVEWIASLRAPVGLQVRLSAEPATHTLTATLALDVDAPSAVLADRDAGALARDLGSILRGATGARFEAIRHVGALDRALAADAWTFAWVARPVLFDPGAPFGAIPCTEAWAPGGPEALRELALALLRSGSAASVVVSIRRATDERVLDLLHERTSAALADVKGRAQGLRFQAGERTFVQRFPEDLVTLQSAHAALAAQVAWLTALRSLPVQLRVAVLGAEDLSEPLLHAVQRACVGTRRLLWAPCTAEQARALADGPLTSLEAPVVAEEADALPVTHPIAELLREHVPAEVAARLFAWPAPGADGLPGLPLEVGVTRPLSNLLLEPVAGALLGTGEGPSGDVKVRIAGPDLARHLYLCGKTGVGKSTVIRTLLRDLALSGQGIGLIDPHGDLAEALVEEIAPHRPVVVFDPSRPDCPGLDPIWHDGTAESVERAVEDLTAILFRLFPSEYMGPMFDRHSRSLLLPLMLAGEGLAQMARLATDEAFRTRCLRGLDPANPLHADVTRFWREEFAAWGRDTRAEMHSYTISKYDTLVKSSALRRVTDPTRAQLDVRAVADLGGVLVARLPQGTLGPVSAYFLGMLLLSRLQAAVFSRSAVRAGARRPFTLALDEFQNFLGGGGFGYAQHDRTLGPLLSEARKFGLRLVLANQYLAQLDDSTRDAVFGNVGSLVCFRVGSRDSELLAAELGGTVTPRELRELPLYRGLARVLREGQPARVFTLGTIP